MVIRNFDEWEQAVLDKQISSVKEEIKEGLPSGPPAKRPLSPLQFRLRKLLQLAILLSGVGAVLLLLINEVPERLEPAVSFLEKLYVGLLGR